MCRRSLLLSILIVSLTFLTCRGPEGPTGPPGPTGDGSQLLTDPSIQPRIIYTNPPANSMGPYPDFSTQFQIRFNKVMDLPSLRRALTLTSQNNLLRVDSSSLRTIGGDVIMGLFVDSLGYSARWRIEQSYRLEISSIAKDVNGNFLVPPFSMTFVPEPYFRVLAVYPRNGARDVYSGGSMELIFNSSVDTSIVSHITITPPLEGRWRQAYYDSASILFEPLRGLSLNTKYTLSLDAAAVDRTGHHLHEAFTSSFETVNFRISSIYPQDGSTYVPPQNNIYVDCTGPIDTSTIRQAFSISPAMVGLFSYREGSQYFTFSPTMADFRLNTKYTISISTALKSIFGDSLAQAATSTFTTDSLRIWGYPEPGSYGVSRTIGIGVSCNAILDTATIRGAFSISPAVAGFLNIYQGSTSFSLTPSSLLEANTTYTVTIGTSFRTKNGDGLNSPYTYSFRTGD